MKSLVDFLHEKTATDKSIIRREIVQGNVKVNALVTEDPATRLTNEYGMHSTVTYRGQTYSYFDSNAEESCQQ